MNTGKYSLMFNSDKDLWIEYDEIQRKYECINLGVGAPDYGAPKILSSALEEVSKSDDPALHQYTLDAGHPRLLNILSKLYSPQFNRNINPDSEIMITNSATEAIYCTLINFIKSGDEIIIIEPYFKKYDALIKLAEGTPRYIPLRSEKNVSSSSDWALDKKELEAMFNSKTKVIIVNTPHNPTGKIFTLNELQHIAELCIRWNVLCIADEVYEWMVYKPSQHLRIATLPEMWDRTITISSIGKTFGVTGWRLGWSFGAPHLIRSLRLFHQNKCSTCNTPLQEAVARALEKEEQSSGHEDSYLFNLPKQLEANRDLMVQALTEIGMTPTVPDGGFFILADWSKFEHKADLTTETDECKDWRFTKWMCKNLRVQFFPLSAFYSDVNKHLGENFVRICFMKKHDNLKKATSILRNWKR